MRSWAFSMSIWPSIASAANTNSVGSLPYDIWLERCMDRCKRNLRYPSLRGDWRRRGVSGLQWRKSVPPRLPMPKSEEVGGPSG